MATILLVEDDPVIRHAFAALLKSEGHEAVAAASSQAAQEAAARRPPQLLLMDVGLPGEDGIDCALRLRAHKGQCPLVFLTAHGGAGLRGARDRGRTVCLPGQADHWGAAAAGGADRAARWSAGAEGNGGCSPRWPTTARSSAAVGMLAERHQWTVAEAFSALRLMARSGPAGAGSRRRHHEPKALSGQSAGREKGHVAATAAAFTMLRRYPEPVAPAQAFPGPPTGSRSSHLARAAPRTANPAARHGLSSTAGERSVCGFAGFVAFGRQRLDAVARHRVLVAMSAALARRGPDDVQYYDDGALSLVFRRLSILDVAGGRQPFFNEAGDQILVANGEVYNHADLRRELQPRHRFASRSDCETLLHGFEEWGTGLFGRMRGMVALAHWDVARTRAHAGARPAGHQAALRVPAARRPALRGPN
ncbi:MAG: response regulator [Rubrivivax sp.]